MERLYRIGKDRYIHLDDAEDFAYAFKWIDKDKFRTVMCKECNSSEFDYIIRVQRFSYDDSYKYLRVGIFKDRYIKCLSCDADVYHKKTFPRWRWQPISE